MWKQLLIMFLILAGLIAWERSLAERTTRTRAESVRIERLFDPKTVFTPDRPIAALRLDKGDGRVHLYVHEQGVWRCVTAFGAVASTESIVALLQKLLGGEFPERDDPPRGVVRTVDGTLAREFGFDTPEMLTFAICGPDVMTDPTGDVIYALDIGRSVPATGGSFVRPLGTDKVWEINVDLRTLLESDPQRPLPPLVDPHIIPAAWPGFHPPGVDRIVIEVAGQPPLEMQRHERPRTEEDIAQGLPTWEWSVRQGGQEFVGHGFQIFSYWGFLMQLPYAGILAPRPPHELGLDQPRAVINIRSANGLVMQLVIGGQTPRGRVPIYNTFSGNIFEVETTDVEMMLPEMDMLLSEHLGNPWERLLRRETPRPTPHDG